jgi:hypothetical protein
MKELLQQLQWALQALALPADVQIRLYPDFVVVADELALEYNNYFAAALGNHPEQFSPTQVQALQSIDALLNEMSGSENAEQWTIDALRSHIKWAEVRILAEQALTQLGWPRNVPPFDPKERGVVYVPGK